mgnify:CR=1 FL=1
MMKTNKSFSKRIKITGSGKLMRRKIGQNHFNAKNSGQEGRNKHGSQLLAGVDVKKFKKHMPFH